VTPRAWSAMGRDPTELAARLWASDVERALTHRETIPAERIVDEDGRQKALDLILRINPKLTPAVSIRWMDGWVRENIEVIYRITPRSITGRQTLNRNRSEKPSLMTTPKVA